MKKEYLIPSINVTYFSVENIVTTSVTNQSVVTDAVAKAMQENGGTNGGIAIIDLVR